MKTYQAFNVTAHSNSRSVSYNAIAESSVDAAIQAADLFGDEPCSVSVKPLKVSQ